MNTHDSHETIFPADPRITAYAFGELEGDELALIEAAVQADPALQAAVAELHGFADTLSLTLLREPLPPVDAQPLPEQPDLPIAAGKGIGGILTKLSSFYYLAGGLAAAGFAVLIAVRTESDRSAKPAHEAPAIMELVDGPAANAVAAKKTEAPTTTVGGKDAGLATVHFDAKLAKQASESSAARERRDADYLSVQKVVETDKVNASNRLIEVERPVAPAMAPPPPMPVQASSGSGLGAGKAGGTARAVRSQVVADGFLMAPSAQPSFSDTPAYEPGSESYDHPADNSYHSVEAEPLSTFSIDVDTASYANVRRFLTGGRLPPRDAVRIEELVNYFPYRYAPPAMTAKNPVPFAAHLEVASAPWAPAHRLVRIGIKGREFTTATRPAANLVFLLDVSGSMNSANKLPLVKESLRLLVERLRPDDHVAIVTYAGSSGLALPPTLASSKSEILAALDNLNASGSTNGAMGIRLAYDIAKAGFVTGGINRVILCTDGDFNVGVTNREELVDLITEKAKSRVFLSVFGFGMGNLKDATLESLADKGNGAYGYIDTRREAEKVFVEQAEGTLATIAKDVKIQVEFNPARVQAYRLIGYENRMLKKEDFNNDAVDAGEIGAGHTVTALYEIVPVGVDDDEAVRPAVDALKYQKTEPVAPKPKANDSPELLTVKIRYKAPEGDVSAKQEFPLIDTGMKFEKASGEFRFASAVAAWGMLLRDSPHKGSATFDQVLNWAEDGLGDDDGGYRAEFIQLVRRSAELK
ncbi:MAG: von Willebrand factor type A domain-containing protein [Opitutaceae bacterium]|jgi:Ca-activated chloride channel family protein